MSYNSTRFPRISVLPLSHTLENDLSAEKDTTNLPPTPGFPMPELPASRVSMPRVSIALDHSAIALLSPQERLRHSSEHDPNRQLISVLHPLQLKFVPKSALSGKAANFQVPITAPPPVADHGSFTRPKCKPFVMHLYKGTKEHFRDISFLGPITLHRIFTLMWLVGSVATFLWLQQWKWLGAFHSSLSPDLSISREWAWVGCICLIPLPVALLSGIGNLMFRYPPVWLDDVKPHSHNVVFRIVSRGTNAACLLETMYKVREAMENDSLFPYLIEVVTDVNGFECPDEEDVIQIKVPIDYETPKKTRFKARALHYASLASQVPDDTWVVHLDEETRPTSSGIKGIAHFVAEAQSLPKVRHIGQGCMTYHRGWNKWPILTLCDMQRTGHDMGLFYLQNNIGHVLLGLHGSYIVCRQDVEKEIGFDLGPRGSITEDAWWGLIAMERGYRLKWCHGYLAEQSPESVMDFLKQRRRWYFGLWNVALFCDCSLKTRFVMAVITFIWALTFFLLPFIVVYTTVLSYFQVPITFFIRITTNFIISANMMNYLAGLVLNMREHGTGFLAGIFWTLAMCITIPLASLFEASGAVMAFSYLFSKNSMSFHVVKKSAATRGTPRVRFSTVQTSVDRESTTPAGFTLS